MTALQKFVDELAVKTGLDPRVLVAWSTQEGAYAANGTGHYNFFNLRPKSGGTSWSGVKLAGVSSGNFAQFATVEDAATETAWWLNHMSNYAGIRAAAGKGTPATQIAAIAASPWDQGHYGGSGGINLKATFARLFGAKALVSPATTDPEGIPWTGGNTPGTQAPNDPSNLLPSGTGIKNPLTGWVSDLTGWLGDTAPYATVYVLLVLFALFLAVMGILALLGIKPGTIASTALKAAAA